MEFMFLNSEAGHDHRQLEAPRPGAAGIKKYHAVQVCNAWLMRVTADDRAKARSGRVDFQLVDVVNDVNTETVHSES